jgi:hypothetical protein
MYNTECSPVIRNSSFLENSSVNAGGGLYVNGGTLQIYDSQFQSNSAKNGGGIFNSGGTSVLGGVKVFNNWTSDNGSGIWNGSIAHYYNLTVYNNVSKGGGGIGIYNQGTLNMTNATLAGNILQSGTSPKGGGLYNAGRAGLANVTIRNNSAVNGGGILNTGSMVLANCIVSLNEASGSGGGIVNTNLEENIDLPSRNPGSHIAALLVNVTLAGNTAGQGGALYNEFEGHPDATLLRNGAVNVMLQNVRITGNEATSKNGGGIYNRYLRYSGMGIFLTLGNATIAGNNGSGLYTKKDSSHTGADYGGSADSGYDDPDDLNMLEKNSFPVHIRFWNSVVYRNSMSSGKASVWDWTGYTKYPDPPPQSRESYEYSLLQGMDLSGTGTGNLDGTGDTPFTPFVSVPDYSQAPTTGGDYRPGNILADPSPNGAGLYPVNSVALQSGLLWEPSIPPNGIGELFMSLPVYFDSLPEEDRVSYKDIFYFLQYDNSFNTGDLRYNWSKDTLDSNWVTAYLRGSWSEGPKLKTRPGTLDIGAYEQ